MGTPQQENKIEPPLDLSEFNVDYNKFREDTW